MKVPLLRSQTSRWDVTSWADDGTDVGVRVEHDGGEDFWNCRVLKRTGIFVNGDGMAHGVAYGWSQIASMTVRELMFETMPAMSAAEARAFTEAAVARADELGHDRHGWQVEPLQLDGATYALFTRRIEAGVVAHADLGWATVSMWSVTALPVGSFEYVEIAAGSRTGSSGS